MSLAKLMGPDALSNTIGPITNSIIRSVLNELDKPNIKNKIMEKLINPALTDVLLTIRPYLISISVVFAIMIILLITILILVIIMMAKH